MKRKANIKKISNDKLTKLHTRKSVYTHERETLKEKLDLF